MTQQQMSEMAKQLEEMQSLDGAMADLQDAKNGMAGRRHEPARRRPEQPRHGTWASARAWATAWAAAAARAIAPKPPTTPPPTPAKVKQQLKKGKAVFAGLHHARQDRQRGRRHRHPGRDRRRHRLGRRRPLQPEDPQEPREAHPVVLRPAQQGELKKGSGTFCRNGPTGASHKRFLTPFFTVQSPAPVQSGTGPILIN